MIGDSIHLHPHQAASYRYEARNVLYLQQTSYTGLLNREIGLL
jgi:hypothetical protein